VWVHGILFGVADSGQVIVDTLHVRATAHFVAVYLEYVHMPWLTVTLIEYRGVHLTIAAIHARNGHRLANLQPKVLVQSVRSSR
jgi:hypothetical protein